MTPPPLTDFFQFIYVDLRGGGKSTGDPSDLTFDVLAADLEAVRKASASGVSSSSAIRSLACSRSSTADAARRRVARHHGWYSAQW